MSHVSTHGSAADSRYSGRVGSQDCHREQRDRLAGLPRGHAKSVEPVYIWSAIAGIVVALVLIGIGLIMQNRAPLTP
jgi:hypothetical protein